MKPQPPSTIERALWGALGLIVIAPITIVLTWLLVWWGITLWFHG